MGTGAASNPGGVASNAGAGDVTVGASAAGPVAASKPGSGLVAAVGEDGSRGGGPGTGAAGRLAGEATASRGDCRIAAMAGRLAGEASGRGGWWSAATGRLAGEATKGGDRWSVTTGMAGEAGCGGSRLSDCGPTAGGSGALSTGMSVMWITPLAARRSGSTRLALPTLITPPAVEQPRLAHASPSLDVLRNLHAACLLHIFMF